MLNFLSIFIGGGIGASLRYIVSLLVSHYGFSYQGTFVVNILGCLFFGFVAFYVLQKEHLFNKNLKLFLLTGVAGGFTTFSTYSLELLKLFESNQLQVGIFYLAASVVVGLLAIWFGMILARAVEKMAQKITTGVFSEPQFMESEIEDVLLENDTVEVVQ